jgi:V/A-type H+-transporting ATPase subunit I
VIISMSKVTLLGMEEEREALMKSLMDFGAIEISSIDAEEVEEVANKPSIQEGLSAVEGELAKTQTALDSLGRHCPEKKPLFKSHRVVSPSEVDKINQERETVWNVVDKISKQEERLLSLKTEENRLMNLRQSLLPWNELTVPLETIGTQKTVFQYGTIPSNISWDQVSSEFEEKAPFSVIKRINSDKELHYIYLFSHAETADACLSYLKAHGYNRVTFHGLAGTAEENILKINYRMDAIATERENCAEQIQKMADGRKSIEILHDILLMEKARIEATGRVLKTKRAFCIKGWVPERVALEAKKALESKYTVSVELEKPADDEEFPVLLENRGLAEAGEPVSKMYSLPNSREIDPNAVMSFFYVAFFGLMLGDGGYGIVLALIAGIALWGLKLQGNIRKFMKLMFYCGLSTVFWGAMFGSWFGISALVKYALWLDIVENPEVMLSWSLLFGVIHMYAGFAMKAANLIREKRYLDALFDAGFWYIFYTGAVLTLLPYAPAVDKEKVAPLVSIGQYLLIGGAILLIFTAGRKNKKLFGKIFGGLSSLYDVVSFLSDILSYSRLLALGLASAIIASIVNQMAVMFDMPIVFKVIMAVAILLVGHGINFAINALGAYVHSCRLQYLEFFGKFFTGGGEPFSPLKANTKYITVKSDAGV